MADSECIDLERLGALERVGGPALVRELIEIFLRHAPQRVAQARQGVRERDWGAVERATHSLKSSAANIGATRLHDAAERLERRSAGGSRGIAALLDEVAIACAEVRRWLGVARPPREPRPARKKRAHRSARTRVRG